MMMRKSIAITAVLALLIATQSNCSKSKAASYVRTAVSALKDTRTILASNNLPTGKLDLAITAGDAAAAAFSSGATNSIELASAFITAFEGVVSDVDVIPNEKLRTMLMVALVVGNIALHALAEILAQDEAANPAIAARVRGSSNVNPIEEFRRKPNWKCRNASTGRYEKMEFCKANSASSVVEKEAR